MRYGIVVAMMFFYLLSLILAWRNQIPNTEIPDPVQEIVQLESKDVKATSDMQIAVKYLSVIFELD